MKFLLALTAITAVTLAGPGAEADGDANIFFLHHSTGRNLIADGEIRDWFADFDHDHGTRTEFWDHDYNYIGLMDPDGELLGYNYGYNTGNTDPIGLHLLWTTDNASRDSILTNHEVIAFKSCYPNSAIGSDQVLQQYRTWYLEMRDVFDQHPEKTFVVMSTPPLHRLATDTDDADRARAFANWLRSPEYLDGHPNVVCYDIFDHLAHPDDGSAVRNQLRWEYELNHNGSDSHPNDHANSVVGPAFAQFLADVAGLDATVDAPAAAPQSSLAANAPNPFNPRTSIRFELAVPGPATLRVHDLRGRIVATLCDEHLDAGAHEVVWNGTADGGQRVAAGTYLYQLRDASGTRTRPMTLVK